MNINDELIKKGFNYLKYYGPQGVARKLVERRINDKMPYDKWQKKHFVNDEEREEQIQASFEVKPLISIVVPTYETPQTFLTDMIDSVRNQTYGRFELCIADGSSSGSVEAIVNGYKTVDRRIKYIRLAENRGISNNTNEALKMAAGDYVALLDHDDFLEADALYWIVKAINDNPKAEMLYTDEDKSNQEGNEFFTPNFKPDFNLGLLRSNNYICHLLVIKRNLLDLVGGLNENYDGAQDYDFILRLSENTNNIIHIPRVLYHWRVSENSTSSNPLSKTYAKDAGRNAIRDHLKRLGLNAEVTDTADFGFYRVKYEMEEKPLVTVLITGNKNDNLFEMSKNAVLQEDYPEIEILRISNSSKAINEAVMKRSDGKYIVLLNENLINIEKGFIYELVSTLQDDTIGAVGGKLFASFGGKRERIYNTGYVLGLGGVIGSPFKRMPGEYSGYMHRASLQMDVSAVSDKLLAIPREIFIALNGLQEDVRPVIAVPDLCLRLRSLKKRVAITPYASAKYRGDRTNTSDEEIKWFLDRWQSLIEKGDPFYNNNFDLKAPGYQLPEN